MFKTKLTLAVELLEELTIPSTLPIRTIEVLLDGGYAEKDTAQKAALFSGQIRALGME